MIYVKNTLVQAHDIIKIKIYHAPELGWVL